MRLELRETDRSEEMREDEGMREDEADLRELREVQNEALDQF